MAEKLDSYHHGDLKTALLEAGREILATDGLAGLTLRRVARRAGVSHAAPYHHFADKTALLAALAADGFEALDREIASRASSSPAEGLQVAAITYVGFAVDNPALFRLMFSSAVPSDASPELRAATSRAYGHITMAVGGGPMAVASWSIVHGLAMLLIDGQIDGRIPSRAEAEAGARDVTQVLWEGLRCYVRSDDET